MQATQRRGIPREPQCQHELIDFVHVFWHNKAQHGAVAVFAEHLVRQFLLGIIRQTGMIDAGDVFVGRQHFRQLFCSVHGLRHTDGRY